MDTGTFSSARRVTFRKIRHRTLSLRASEPANGEEGGRLRNGRQRGPYRQRSFRAKRYEDYSRDGLRSHPKIVVQMCRLRYVVTYMKPT